MYTDQVTKYGEADQNCRPVFSVRYSAGDASFIHHPAKNVVEVLMVVEDQFDLLDLSIDQRERKEIFPNALFCQRRSGAVSLIHKFYFSLAGGQFLEKVTGVVNIIDLHMVSSSQ